MRIDLDYVPWDTPDAEAFGHGEPAMLLRLLEMARASGLRFQFFASNRVLRAFPASPEAVLSDGHDLDWFCKHPSEPGARLDEALRLFREIGHQPIGLALRGAWPADGQVDLSGFRFISCAPGPVPGATLSSGSGEGGPDLPLPPPSERGGLIHFPVETRGTRDAMRSGLSARAWTDATKTLIREHASRRLSVTVVVRPQVLAKYDPRLGHVREILEIAGAAGMEIKTLRQAIA